MRSYLWTTSLVGIMTVQSAPAADLSGIRIVVNDPIRGASVESASQTPLIAVSNAEDGISVWNYARGLQIQTVIADGRFVKAIRLSALGHLLYIKSNGSNSNEWFGRVKSVVNGMDIQWVTANERILDCIFADDGDVFFTLHEDGTIRAYSMNRAKLYWESKSAISPRGIVASPDALHIVAWNDTQFEVWKVSASAPTATLSISGRLAGPELDIPNLIMTSPKGEGLLVFAKSMNGEVTRMSLKTGQTDTIGTPSVGRTMFDATADGNAIILESESEVSSLDVRSLRCEHLFNVPTKMQRLSLGTKERPAQPPLYRQSCWLLSMPEPLVLVQEERDLRIYDTHGVLQLKPPSGSFAGIVQGGYVAIHTTGGLHIWNPLTGASTVLDASEERFANRHTSDSGEFTLGVFNSIWPGNQHDATQDGATSLKGPRLIITAPLNSFYAERFFDAASVTARFASDSAVIVAITRGESAAGDRRIGLKIGQRHELQLWNHRLDTLLWRKTGPGSDNITAATINPSGTILAWAEQGRSISARDSADIYIANINQPDRAELLLQHRMQGLALPKLIWLGDSELAIARGKEHAAVVIAVTSDLKDGGTTSLPVPSNLYSVERIAKQGPSYDVTSLRHDGSLVTTFSDSSSISTVIPSADGESLRLRPLLGAYRDDLIVLSRTHQTITWLHRNNGGYEFMRKAKLDNVANAERIGVIAENPSRPRLLAVIKPSGVSELIDYHTGILIATTIAFSSGSMTVIPSGQFDRDLSQSTRGISWIASDDPFNPLSPEMFMRDYYEPELLTRVLSGQKLPSVRPLQDLNRAQPEISDLRLYAGQGAGFVNVEVDVQSRAHEVKRESGEIKQWHSGVHDVRLLRDGQLVRQYPETDETQLGRGNSEETLATWREATDAKPTNGKITVRFNNVLLPHQANGNQVAFAAYAFSRDRVKSATSDSTVYPIGEVEPDASWKPRAYVVTVGVEKYESPDWDLDYAADDAKLMQNVLLPRLNALEEDSKAKYEVLPIQLTADSNQQDATKSNIKGVFELLAKEVTPDDLVIVFFSSHGYSDSKTGEFYLFPYDIGSGLRKQESLPQHMLDRCISSDELAQWFRPIDGGEMVLIVDACQSAATVKQPGFKPGPMGDRGLGQLAYDKRMCVLASTQADDYAIEDEKIQLGLLTFALAKKGLSENLADYQPKDGQILIGEWLSYAVSAVPGFYELARQGKLKTAVKPPQDDDSNSQSSLETKNIFQRPQLFDYSKRQVQLSKGRG